MVQLYGGATPAQGIVLMCMGNTWGPVCGNYWVTAQVKVICGQLGYTGKYMYGGMPSDLILIKPIIIARTVHVDGQKVSGFSYAAGIPINSSCCWSFFGYCTGSESIITKCAFTTPTWLYSIANIAISCFSK